MGSRSAAVAAMVVLAGWCTTGGIAAADPPPPPPAPKTVIDTNGTYAVGADIAPGTYRTDGGADGSACYFKRLRGEEIVDSTLTKKPLVIRIEPTDTAFKTSRCQPWRLVACPPTCAPDPDQHASLPDVLKGFVPQPPAGAGGG